MRTIEREEVPVAIKNDNVELRMSEAGDMTVSFVTISKGADLAPALVGLPFDLCQCPHWGYMLKGKVKMKMKDGEQVYEAGDVFYWGRDTRPRRSRTPSTSTSPRPRSSRRSSGTFRAASGYPCHSRS